MVEVPTPSTDNGKGRTMAERYSQLNLGDRKKIEEALDGGSGFREIGRLVGRSPSTDLYRFFGHA